MTKIIFAPDSFKGTMSSRRVCEIMKKAALDVLPKLDIMELYIADGGEGTVDALRAKRVNTAVSGPFFEVLDSFYGVLDDATNNKTAIIEIAACCGLQHASGRLNPEITTSYGAGELIINALNDGIRNFIIALGGSCTNDAGCGMAAALGVKFTGKNGGFIPVGKTLTDITHIDISGIDKRISESSFSVMCDVSNTLYGQNGAAYIFAPQKGADADMVKRLDAGLKHFADVVLFDLDIDLSTLEGGGAAGGMGAGAYAFLSAELKSGIELILEYTDFDRHLEDAALVITGEGKFDAQSVGGKAVSGIARHAKKAGVPIVVVAGGVEDIGNINELGLTAVFSIQRKPLAYEQAILASETNLYETTANIIRLFLSARGII